MDILRILKDFIEGHYAKARVRGNKLQALEVSVKDGHTLEKWVTLKPTFSAVKDWLGY